MAKYPDSDVEAKDHLHGSVARLALVSLTLAPARPWEAIIVLHSSSSRLSSTASCRWWPYRSSGLRVVS